MSSRRSTRYRNPSAGSFASAVSRSMKKKKGGGKNSMSAPLLGENEHDKRRQVHRGRFMRQLSAHHPMNALTSSVNGLKNRLASMSASSSTHHKKSQPVDGNRSSAIETSPHGADAPPPLSPIPTPPQTSLFVVQDMPQFDFAGSTNYFKSLDDSTSAANSDDLSFSDDGVNLWELANTEDTEEIDFLLTQIMNNAPMYIRRTDAPITGEEQISRPQNTDSMSPVSSDYENDIIEENHHAVQDSRATDATDDSFSAWHDEEGKLDAYFGFASEPEELSVDPGVDVTCNGADDEEDSIHGFFLSDEAATSLNVAAQAKTKNKDVDSALAWSALSFILGSPAPATVTKKNSRKESAKLWDLDTGAECDDIPDLLPTGDELECAEEGILDPPDMIRFASLQLPKQGIHVDRKDTVTTLSLTSDDTSLSRSMVDDSINALGSLGEDSIPDLFVSNDQATSFNVAEGTNAKNEEVDSALAWSALSFILGSPAPATVTRKNSRKESAKLWDFDAGECDDIPDLSCVTP